MFNWFYRKGRAWKEEPEWTRSRVGVVGITSTQPKASLFSFFSDAERGQGWTEAQCTTERDRWREGRKRWLEEEESKERTLSAVTWHGHTRVWKALWRAAVQLHILWFSVKRSILEECVQVREWENDRTECVCVDFGQPATVIIHKWRQSGWVHWSSARWLSLPPSVSLSHLP